MLETVSITASDFDSDSEWDGWLRLQGNNHHLQSSLWARIKQHNGWRARRVIASKDGKIVGGAQLLIRKTKLLGRVGYVPKGPVFATESCSAIETLIRQIQSIARQERLRVLFVQPNPDADIEHQLVDLGFRSCPLETAPSATIHVDLTASLDLILARMTKSMRNAVRRSQKRGIVVRTGNRNDLAAFHRVLASTAERRGFSVFDLEYFLKMWDILEPTGSFKLFISELENEVVSAQICIPFGDTIIAKQIGWSGDHGKLHPNEALDWFTIQWAKENGFHNYDLEGIERDAAKALLANEPLPDKYSSTPTAYKLKLGGTVKLFPPAYCYIQNATLRLIFNTLGHRMASWTKFQEAIGRFRTG